MGSNVSRIAAVTTSRGEELVSVAGRGTPLRRLLGPASRLALLITTLVALYACTASRALRLPNPYSIGHWLQSYDHGFIKRGLLGTALRPFLALEGSEQIRETIAIASFVVFALFSAAMIIAGAMTLRRDNRVIAFALWCVLLGSPFVVFSAHIVGYFDPLIATMGLVSVYLVARGHWLAAGLLSAVAILIHEMYAVTAMPMVVFCAWLRLAELDANARWQPLLKLLLAPTIALLTVLLSSLLQSEEVVAAVREDIAARGVIEQYWVDISTYHLEHGFLDNFGEQQRWAWARLRNKRMNIVVYPALIALLLGGSVRLYQLGRARWTPVYVAFALSPWLMHWVAWDMERIAILPIFGAALGFFGMCVVSGPAGGLRPLPRLLTVTVLAACLVAALASAWTPVPLMDGQRDGEGPFSFCAARRCDSP